MERAQCDHTPEESTTTVGEPEDVSKQCLSYYSCPVDLHATVTYVQVYRRYYSVENSHCSFLVQQTEQHTLPSNLQR